MISKYYKKGALITEISLLQILSDERQPVFIETDYSLAMIPAWELLRWQLRSLLRVRLYKAVKMKKAEFIY
jgi:hypothetical protein